MRKEIRSWLTLAFAMTIFLTTVMIVSGFFMAGVAFWLQKTGVLDRFGIIRRNPEIALPVFLIINIIVAAVLVALFSKPVLSRLRKIINATQQVAQGNFHVQVDEDGGIAELSELAKSFNRMTQELSSIEPLRSDFINNISHEFKTPIVSIRGFAKLLRDETLSGKERLEYIDIIIAESERLAALSTNILNLSKYESLEIIADKTTYRLDEQIRAAIVLTERKWAEKNIGFDVVMDAVPFVGNADLTQQIWINLLDNAIKFSPQDGAITVRLFPWNRGLRFTIKDCGIGMDENTIAHIFNKFYQGDSSEKSGNGLGLAIVKRIVELCGGSVEAKSNPGEGSELIVWLPVLRT